MACEQGIETLISSIKTYGFVTYFSSYGFCVKESQRQCTWSEISHYCDATPVCDTSCLQGEQSQAFLPKNGSFGSVPGSLHCEEKELVKKRPDFPGLNACVGWDESLTFLGSIFLIPLTAREGQNDSLEGDMWRWYLLLDFSPSAAGKSWTTSIRTPLRTALLKWDRARRISALHTELPAEHKISFWLPKQKAWPLLVLLLVCVMALLHHHHQAACSVHQVS